jgi:two-component system, OmpR family, response regulator QseB
MNRILIVEDETHIFTPVQKGLRANGFITSIAATGQEAIDLAVDADFDLIILDLGLPDMDGWAVLQELRKRGEKMPIIILTARDDIHDKIAGLEGGANDYMTKPFSFQELLARVRLRLKENKVVLEKEEHILKSGNISLDLHTHQVYIDDNIVELPAREFTLLETLMKNPGFAISREQLLKEVWGYDYDPGTNIVDVYVGYLRKKMGNKAIETVRGIGYRLYTLENSRKT